MSDSVSTASQTIASQLTGASSNLSSIFGGPNNCMASNIRFFFWMISVLCLLCLCFTMMSNMIVACSDNQDYTRDNLEYIPAQPMVSQKRQCRYIRQPESFDNHSVTENFSNDVMYSYKHSLTSNYQTIALTAPDTTQKTPANLVFGEARRYITSENEIVKFRLDISANLYVLDGNILNQRGEKAAHSYQAYLVNNAREISIGPLKRGGDGIYKLKMETDKTNDLLTARGLIIKYELDNESTVLLKGTYS